MLGFVMVVVLAQADVGSTEQLPSPPPPPPAIVEEPPPRALTPKTVRHSATLFSSPQVDGPTLIGRMALGFLGSVGGGAVSAAILGFALIASGGGSSAAPFIIAAPFALASLGLGTALGAAAFGKYYVDDLADAVLVSMVTCLVSVALVITCLFLFPVAIVPVVIAAALFPAVATPLFVQVFKPADEAAVALARF